MSDYDFSGGFSALFFAFCGLAVLAPFGIWKLVEIAIWFWKHIHFTL